MDISSYLHALNLLISGKISDILASVTNLTRPSLLVNSEHKTGDESNIGMKAGLKTYSYVPVKLKIGL